MRINNYSKEVYECKSCGNPTQPGQRVKGLCMPCYYASLRKPCPVCGNAMSAKSKQCRTCDLKAAIGGRTASPHFRRDSDLLAEYDKGELTMKDLGIKYDLSTARVSQIIARVRRGQEASNNPITS